MSKLKVGININEILRARWLQFDRYYVQEFGEEGVPEMPYVYDFFNKYKWEDKTEIIKELKEPEIMPDNINPVHYQVDDKLDGESPADVFLFKTPEKITLTAKEIYNRFMYEDFVFEIFGTAPIMYKGMDLHVKQFYEKYKDTVDFTIYSDENQFSIPSTLFFLSKMTCRFNNYCFVENKMDMLNNVDVFITTDPEIFTYGYYLDRKIIKLKRPYNENFTSINCSVEAIQLNDLNGNEEFEKIINYIKPEKNE